MNGYGNLRCSCVDCRAAAAEYQRAATAAPRPPLPQSDPRHGTPSAYRWWKCRCDTCRAANAAAAAAGRPVAARPGQSLRSFYGVPAYIGGRVAWTSVPDMTRRVGTITGFDREGMYLLIKFDGEGRARRRARFHPTDRIEYLTEEPRL